MRFELVQPDEFDEYYYEIISDDGEPDGIIDFDVDGWVLDELYYDRIFNVDELIQVTNKITELNSATKADKLFGFL